MHADRFSQEASFAPDREEVRITSSGVDHVEAPVGSTFEAVTWIRPPNGSGHTDPLAGFRIWPAAFVGRPDPRLCRGTGPSGGGYWPDCGIPSGRLIAPAAGQRTGRRRSAYPRRTAGAMRVSRRPRSGRSRGRRSAAWPSVREGRPGAHGSSAARWQSSNFQPCNLDRSARRLHQMGSSNIFHRNMLSWTNKPLD